MSKKGRKGSKAVWNFSKKKPTPLFRQCPKENVFFNDVFPYPGMRIPRLVYHFLANLNEQTTG